MEAPAALKTIRSFEMPEISFVPLQTGEVAKKTAERMQRMLCYEIFFELLVSS
jgi:hypothetical protein